MKRTIGLLLIFLCFAPLCMAADNANLTPQQQQQLQALLEASRQSQQAQGAAPAQNAPNANPATTNQPAAAAPVVSAQSAVGVQATGAGVSAVDTGADPRDEAFAGMASTLLPMTPNQIRTLHHLYDETQRAAVQYPGIPPKPTSSSLSVSLAPGATPPVIRLTSGFVTALVFLDRSSAPWPIVAYDLGDPSAFNIQWDRKSNMLLVQAITQYKTANLAVQLQGLNTPVMLTLLAGQQAVDYRVDLHVPGLGPYGVVASDSGLPAPASPILLNILSGIPPIGSCQLQVTPDGYADVWLYHARLYVRTRATILSPAWLATMSSSDGTNAYSMPITPLIIASQNGKPINLSIQGY